MQVPAGRQAEHDRSAPRETAAGAYAVAVLALIVVICGHFLAL